MNLLNPRKVSTRAVELHCAYFIVHSTHGMFIIPYATDLVWLTDPPIPLSNASCLSFVNMLVLYLILLGFSSKRVVSRLLWLVFISGGMNVLKHLNSVGKWLGECGQDGIDSFQELGLEPQVSKLACYWGTGKLPHQGMVVTYLLEILCPALNFRNRDHSIRVSGIRTEHIIGNWPPSTEGVDDQDSIGIYANFWGVLWFCSESLWWHVAGKLV